MTFYGSEPTNSTAVLEGLRDPRIRGYLVDHSVPFTAVDLPLVTVLPNPPQKDRAEVNLYNAVAGTVIRYIWIEARNAWFPLSSLVPAITGTTGTLGWTAAAAAPAGALLADGASYLRTSFAALFTAIGVVYGSVDGTHFNVPDMRDRAPVGAGTSFALGSNGGLQTVTLGIGEIPSHTHTGPSHNHTISSDGSHSHTPLSGTGGDKFIDALGGATANITTGGGGYTLSATTGSAGAHTHGGASGAAGTGATGSAGTGGAHNNMPPYLALNAIIWT